MEVGVDEPEWNTSTRVVGASPTLDEGTRSMTASCSSVGWGESRSIDVELWYRQRTTKTQLVGIKLQDGENLTALEDQVP